MARPSMKLRTARGIEVVLQDLGGSHNTVWAGVYRLPRRDSDDAPIATAMCESDAVHFDHAEYARNGMWLDRCRIQLASGDQVQQVRRWLQDSTQQAAA